MAQGDIIQKDLGLVTAYGYALAGGYRGTEEQFKIDFARLMNNEIEDVEYFDATSCWAAEEESESHLRNFTVRGSRLGRTTYVNFAIETDGQMSYFDSFFGIILHASEWAYDNYMNDLVKKVTQYSPQGAGVACTEYSKTDWSWPYNGALVTVENQYNNLWIHTESGTGQRFRPYTMMPMPVFKLGQPQSQDCNAPMYINYTVSLFNRYGTNH